MNTKIDEIKKIIAEVAIADINDINDDDTLKNIGIDSLRAVELIITLEDELMIKFDDSDLNPAALSTISDKVETKME